MLVSELLLMDKILHYPLGIYHNSHSLGSLKSCRILSINSMEAASPKPSSSQCEAEPEKSQPPKPYPKAPKGVMGFLGEGLGFGG